MDGIELVDTIAQIYSIRKGILELTSDWLLDPRR